MANVIIAKLVFPNDPTNACIAHQMFIAEQTGKKIQLYSISSILGKEKRVYGKNSDDYFLILDPESRNNGFKVPSFIDCTKVYEVELSSSVNLSLLEQRSLTSDLYSEIVSKIEEKKDEGKQTVYNITENDFKSWNPKL